MDTYTSLDVMFVEAILDCVELGDKLDSRNGGCLEIIGWTGRLLNPDQNLLTIEERNISRAYGFAELFWYLGGLNEIRWLTPFAPSYKNYSDDGVTANGAYGPRGLSLRHLKRIVEILDQDPNSRQAVLNLWAPDDLVTVQQKGSRDIPCTIALQFFVRGGQLYLITTMRSNDVWLGLPYDVFCFTTIQMLVASELGLPCGWYQHQVGSMHLYEKNDLKARKAMTAVPNESEQSWAGLNSLEQADYCVNQLRTMVELNPNDANLDNPYIRCMARKLNPEIEEPEDVRFN